MSETLLQKIRRGIITNQWKNNLIGKFEYIAERTCYRFIETTDHPYCYLVAEYDRNDENCPIIISRFIAFLIACWGQDEVAIYRTYNEKKRAEFLDIEAKKPGSFKQNLEKEFAIQLLKTEQENIISFKNSFDFITVEERAIVLEYAGNYLDYTSSAYNQPGNKRKEHKVRFIDLLIHQQKEEHLTILHKLLDNTKGKDFAVVIIALNQLGLLGKYNNKRTLFKALQTEFGDIGTESNFNYYLNPNNRAMILDSEIESVINTLLKI